MKCAVLSVFSLIFVAACGHAQSPADAIALGPSKTCAGGAVWDGIECATPHAQSDSDGDEGVSTEVATATSTSKHDECDGEDCDDVLARPPSSDTDYMAQGIAAYDSHDFAKARKLFYDLISKHPNSVHAGDAYFWFGKMFEEDAKTDKSKLSLAKAAFEQASAYPKSPQASAALLELGIVCLELGETGKANGTFAMLRKRFPGSAAATKIPPGH